MTEKEFREDLEKFIGELFNLKRPLLPFDTGNLRNNAYKLEKTSSGYSLWIDPSIAPYVKYLVPEGSRTKKEYLHWDDVCTQIINAIIQKYSDIKTNNKEE